MEGDSDDTSELDPLTAAQAAIEKDRADRIDKAQQAIAKVCQETKVQLIPMIQIVGSQITAMFHFQAE